MSINQSTFINQLSYEVQQIILTDITNTLSDTIDYNQLDESIELAMNSRLCDISELVNVQKYITLESPSQLESNLLNACNALQVIDSNGFYLESWQEYLNNDITLEDVQEGLINAINTMIEDTYSDDEKMLQTLHNLLSTIND